MQSTKAIVRRDLTGRSTMRWGTYLKRYGTLKKKIQKSKSFIQIADELEEEPDNIQSLYECISQNINLTTEEIYKIYISPDKTED